MKKAFMLVAAIALLAAPVFAEITVSGEFEVYYAHEFSDNTASETYEENGNEIVLDLGIEIGEFTELNTELSAGFDDLEADNDDSIVVSIDGWSVTQDITGALGVDGPITFSVEMGDVSFKGEQFVDELDALTDEDNDNGTDIDGSYIDFLFAVGIMDMVTVEIAFLPGTFADQILVNEDLDVSGALPGGADQFGINVIGEFGPLSIAAYFASSDETQDLAINGLVELDALEAGFQVQMYDLEADADMDTYVFAEYAMDNGLTLTLEHFNEAMLSDLDMEIHAKVEFEIEDSATFQFEWGATAMLSELDMEIQAEVSYPVSDVVEVHAQFDIESLLLAASESILVKVGTDLEIGAMEYELNYVLGTENTDGGEEMSHTVSLNAKVSF